MSKVILPNKEIDIIGNIFIMSDIHACFRTFKKALDIINFKDTDFLIIDGDAIDRGGKNNVDLINFIKDSKNILLLRGNHEEFLLRTLSNELSISNWDSFGGKNTITEMNNLSNIDYLNFTKFIKNTPLYCKVIIENKEYFISHNGLNVDLPLIKNNGTINIEETIKSQYSLDWFNFFISSDIHYIPSTYKFDYYWITGHTPTIKITNEAKIIKRKIFMDIDCGCSYNNGMLGVINLCTFEEYYVNIVKKDFL